MTLIQLGYSVFFVWGIAVFEFADTVWFFVVLVGSSIIRYIHIPPGVVIIDAVPGVVGQGSVIGCAVHDVARDILASAEGGEEIGEIIADTFMCA